MLSIPVSHFTAAEYETAIGYLDVKTASAVISFYVQRNSTYSSTGTVIPYEVERLNNGGAMNLATSVFTGAVSSMADIILILLQLRGQLLLITWSTYV